ncbi:MAG: pyruvate kinase [Candidatus Staskawiczbacteria bacterium]|nr:pyruvate kinase [Candidatus Staskawiczbacteria bacterium]
MFSHKRTKIIATIGPSSQEEEVLESLILQGIDAARLNFSHGSHQEHGSRIDLIRKLEKKLHKQIAIIADLQGPKIRVGNMPSEGLELRNGDTVMIDTSKKDFENGVIPLPSPIFRDGTKEGHIVFLDDGVLQLKVLSKKGSIFEAIVLKGGFLFSKKGVNVPLIDNKSDILSDKDKEDMAFAISKDVDYIALSFLRNAEDVKIARSFLKGATTKIIAKIERPEALKNLDEITDQVDAVMVARGDLGIETPLWELPVRQKEIVQRVRKRMKPVIVATQMLDSMIRNPIPTRAEVSDVANAVYDGADAVMLSGESAQGKYPVEAVEMMRKVLEATELEYKDGGDLKENLDFAVLISVAQSATQVAKELQAKAIIAGTVTGNSARVLSHFRPVTSIISIAENEKVARELALVWGVNTLVIKNKKFKTVEKLIEASIDLLKKEELFKKGEKVVCLFGEKLGITDKTNTITVKSIS